MRDVKGLGLQSRLLQCEVSLLQVTSIPWVVCQASGQGNTRSARLGVRVHLSQAESEQGCRLRSEDAGPAARHLPLCTCSNVLSCKTKEWWYQLKVGHHEDQKQQQQQRNQQRRGLRPCVDCTHRVQSHCHYSSQTSWSRKKKEKKRKKERTTERKERERRLIG